LTSPRYHMLSCHKMERSSSQRYAHNATRSLQSRQKC